MTSQEAQLTSGSVHPPSVLTMPDLIQPWTITMPSRSEKSQSRSQREYLEKWEV